MGRHPQSFLVDGTEHSHQFGGNRPLSFGRTRRNWLCLFHKLPIWVRFLVQSSPESRYGSRSSTSRALLGGRQGMILPQRRSRQRGEVLHGSMAPYRSNVDISLHMWRSDPSQHWLSPSRRQEIATRRVTCFFPPERSGRPFTI